LSRKEKIIATATHLFVKKRFSKTSTLEITEKAGVAHGTIFYHFKNNEGVIYEIIKRSGHNYIEEINTAVS
jgi:AcrR family transcriptional regulator